MPMKINLHNRTFIIKEGTSNGEVSGQTIFKYFQEGDLVWADYSGGTILKGNLMAKVGSDGKLDMVYHHINSSNEIRTGICKSTPEINDNGKIVLNEKWKWTSGDFSEGESTLVEL